MASTINVKIAPLPRGDYSSSATYAKLDIVSYNGSSYMAIKAVPTGTVPTNTAYWQLLVDNSVTDGAVTTAKLADGAVTDAKLAQSGGVLEEVHALYNVKTGSGNAEFVFFPFRIDSGKKFLIENTSNAKISVATTQTNSTSETKTETIGNISAKGRLVANPTLSANYFRIYCNGSATFKITDLSTKIVEIENELDDFLGYRKIVPVTENLNKFWDITKSPITMTSYTGYYVALDAIPVQYGEIYDIYIRTGTSAKQRGWVLVDASYNMLSSADASTQDYHSFTVNVDDEDAKYLMITVNGNQSEYLSVTKRILGDNKLKGLKMSLLGDSISAFNGTLPAGNAVYYTGNPNANAGVYRASDMWWYKVCAILGLEPLVINGWSGSLVTSGVRESSIVPASDISRCEALHSGATNPDIILIAMGVNDYSYSAPMGTWDGRTNPNSDTTTFRTAYATMLNRIQTKYPDSLVVCITPWFMQRGINTSVTYINGDGLTVTDFGDAIRDIADLMHCPVIDGTNIGFNRYNYYPTYCEDSETTPTHPNANGQCVMGVTIADELRKICRGYINELS